MRRPAPTAPRIVVTVAVAARQTDPAIAARKNALYAASVDPPRRRADRPRRDVRRGDARAAAFADDGRPAHQRRRRPRTRRATASRAAGSTTVEPDRDALEAEAWTAAQARAVAGPRPLPRLPGDQRVLRRHAPPARRRPPGPALGDGPGEDPSAARRARHAARPDPLPDQRRRRRPRGELATTTRRSGRPTWRRASSPTPGRAARPAT